MTERPSQACASIEEIAAAMTPAERHAASVVFANVMQTFALHGSDYSIPGAQILSECIASPDT